MANAPVPDPAPHYKEPGWFTRNVPHTLTPRRVSPEIVRLNTVGKHRKHWNAREDENDDKVTILRAYRKRWKAEVGVFFDGVGPDSSDDELRSIAPRHPVFALTEA